MRREEFKWALVTGASSGIGEALSRLLAHQGINLIINGRHGGRLQALAKELRELVQVETIVADLADPLQRQPLVDAIWEHAPELVINNAGFGLYGEALTYETHQQLDVLEVNGAAALELTLEGARALVSREKKGVIMNIASAAAFSIFPSVAVYAAAKSFIVSLSESLDAEMRPLGVRVLASCPGMVSTNFRQRASGCHQVPSGDVSMPVSYAAEQVWKQIKNKKTVNIFNWKYRLLIFLVRYVLPKKWVAASVKNNIDKRHPFRPIIKDPKEKNKYDPFQ